MAYYPKTMEQHIPQEEVRRIIISDMVKKRGSIVPVIGEDTIVYKDEDTAKEVPFQEFILNEFQMQRDMKEQVKSTIWITMYL